MMNPKTIEVQQVTIFHAMNLLTTLRNEIMEIVKDPTVNAHIQPDTTAIEEEFDSLEAALLSARNFAGTVKNILVEKYFSQFEVIDGLNQHPSGLPFDDWAKINELITHFGRPRRTDDIDEADAMFKQHQAMKAAMNR
jgi:hypothetical protein